MTQADWERAHHSLYVIELHERVFRVERFRQKSPGRNPVLPCVYVGMTGLTPEDRFRNHKRGDNGSWYAREFGERLLPDLFEKFNPVPYTFAKPLEGEYAEWLRSRGYGVWWN